MVVLVIAGPLPTAVAHKEGFGLEIHYVVVFVALDQGTFPRRRYHMSTLLTADKFSFRSHELSSLGLREALTYSRSKMRAARSDLGCAAPKSAMNSRHHGEARCDRRSRLGARCRRRGTWRRTVRSPTAAWCDDVSAGRRAMLTMAANRGESRGPRRFKSQPRCYPMRRMPEPARRFSCLTTCQTAMNITLFRSCRGTSAALFVRRR